MLSLKVKLMSSPQRPNRSAAKLTIASFFFISGVFILGELIGDSQPKLFSFIATAGILVFGVLIVRYTYLFFKR